MRVFSTSALSPLGGYFKRSSELKMFRDFHGEYYARLKQDQSVLGSSRSSLWWPFHILSTLFFGIPEQYRATLDGVWVDSMLCVVRWNEFLASTRRQWERTITPVGTKFYHNHTYVTTDIGLYHRSQSFCRLTLDSWRFQASTAVILIQGAWRKSQAMHPPFSVLHAISRATFFPLNTPLIPLKVPGRR